MLNKAMLIGRVGSVDIRTMQNGNKVANLSIATSEKYKTKAGEKKERVEWHKVVCFKPQLVQIMEQYLNKGDIVYIAGTIRTNKWQDQSGQDRYTTEIYLDGFDAEFKFISSKKSSGQTEEASTKNPVENENDPLEDELDDNIPF